jgi:class 3 adenylate cyclase
MIPETRYTKSGDVYIAYQLIGAGPVDMVYVPGYASNLAYNWEWPPYARFLQRLGTFSRVIAIDRRGTGLSDRVSPEHLPTLEVMIDDIRAVMDAVGSDRAALFGFADGAVTCALFAATHPERTMACLLYSMFARGSAAPDYPWAWTPEFWDSYTADIRERWGTREFFDELIAMSAPTLRHDEAYRRWQATYFALAASPSAAMAIELLYRDVDIRHVLPSIRVPTLILHRKDDSIEPVGGARHVAKLIRGSRFVELDGADHVPWAGNQDALTGEIERFLHGVGAEEAEFDRVLATVMFTDIVDSTSRAATLGDQGWHRVLENHNSEVRAYLARFRGREVKTIGDGFLATFDGPARAIGCARAVAGGMRDLGVEVRTGLHTGEIELVGDDVRGMAVNIGARVSALAGPGEVLVSSTVKDLVAGSGFAFEDRGERELKGVPGRWRLYAVTDG